MTGFLGATADLLVPAAFTFVAAVISGGLTFWLTRRNTSGNADTSDAGTLWKASTEFQAAVLAEAKRLRDEVAQLRDDALDSFNDALKMRADLAECRDTVADLRRENAALRQQAGLPATVYPSERAVPASETGSGSE